MQMTRRKLLGIAALVSVGAIAGAAQWERHLGLVRASQAQPLSPSEISKAGPLGDEVEGKADAPVTVIEYASMTCPHCANFDINVFPLIKSRYIDTGEVRYILREFPLDQLAAAGFMLARCSGAKYFDMIHVLFQRQRDWVVERPLDPLLEIAKQAGFTKQKFDECLANQSILQGIEDVRQRAADKLGVDSTPTFFINGQIHRGEMTFADFEAVVKPLLGAGT
jgi:protein-disulfide isomerase